MQDSVPIVGLSSTPNERSPWDDAVKIVGPGSTVEQAISEGNLGRFEVRETKSGKRELLCEHRGSPASVRSLGTVRSNHVPLQNSEAFALFQPLIDSGCISIESISDWRGGERVWIVFKILKYENAEDQDRLRPFLLFGHDPFTNYFKLSYLFVRTATNGILTEGTFHNPGPSIPPHDHLPRRFSAGFEKAREEMQLHLLGVIDTFQRMNRLPVNSDQVDSYLLDIARRLPKPGERFRRTRLSDDQTSQLYSACKEQLLRRDARAGDQTPTTLWDAYNAAVEWVDREANALQGWERLRELWSSGIKDDALYEALMRIESDSVGNSSTRHS